LTYIYLFVILVFKFDFKIRTLEHFF